MDQRAVREGLGRVLASPGFAKAHRLSRFLQYLVEETLAGRQDVLKEYTIGVEIYQRKLDYDPKIDAIVRVEASRLRTKLKQYYGGIGKDDPVRIDLPPGGYIPVLWNGPLASTVVRAEPRPVTARPARRRCLVLAAAAVAMIALVTLAAFRLVSGGGQTLSLAVEPLANLTGDAEMGQLAAEVTQQFTNALAQVEGFSVKTHSRDASARIEGSVERAGDRACVLLRLVRPDGYQAWSRKYVSLPDAHVPFTDAVSQLAARTLRAQFAGDPARLHAEAHSATPEATALYLKGHELWNTQLGPGVEQSAALFHQAILRDPRFARAYEGLSASELYLRDLDPKDAQGHLSRARQAAQQAIALDDRLSEAHARLGNIRLYLDWNFPAAEQELLRAVILNPGRSEISRWFALAAQLRHHDSEARHELELGAIANGASEVILTELARMDFEAGDRASARRLQRLALQADPRYKLAHLLAGRMHQAAGEFDLAAREFRSCQSPGTFGIRCTAALGELCARTGQTAEALRIARSLPLFWLAALVYLGLNDRVLALRALEQSYSAHESELPWISVDPRFAQLRGEPGYQRLVRSMGL
jgi:TolB-like protein